MAEPEYPLVYASAKHEMGLFYALYSAIGP